MKKYLMVLLAMCGLISLHSAEASKVLVVYFSWSDGANTGRVAEVIAKETKADLVRLQPAKPYSRKYNEVLSRGRAELNKNQPCPIEKVAKEVKNYETVFVGTPIWFGTFAPPVKTFLQENKWAGKKLFFFCTHGSGGAGRFFGDAAKLCAGAQIGKGFSCYGNHSAKSAPQVKKWLKENFK